MGLFAPPDLFAEVAVAARGDEDLPDGVHLRLMPSPALGFPIAPFAIFRVVAFLAEPQVLWRDRAGKVLPAASLDAAGGVLFGDHRQAADRAGRARRRRRADGGRPFRGIPRAHRSRRQPPVLRAQPRAVHRRRAARRAGADHGTWTRHRPAHVASRSAARARTAASARSRWHGSACRSTGSRAWYAKGLGSRRVVRSGEAGRRAPAAAAGPAGWVPSTRSRRRTIWHASACTHRTRQAVRGDGRTHRQGAAARSEGRTISRCRSEQHFIDVGIADTLMVQAMDPGLGRYLGLVGAIDERGRRVAAARVSGGRDLRLLVRGQGARRTHDRRIARSPALGAGSHRGAAGRAARRARRSRRKLGERYASARHLRHALSAPRGARPAGDRRRRAAGGYAAPDRCRRLGDSAVARRERAARRTRSGRSSCLPRRHSARWSRSAVSKTARG